MTEKRIRTYVNGLDELMGGGVPAKSVVFVCGKSGTMKSTFSYYILFNNAKVNKKRGIYVTLKQTRVSLLEHMIKLGFDPRTLSDSGIVVIDMTRIRREVRGKALSGNGNVVDSIFTTIKSYKDKYECDILVLDSLTILYSLTTLKDAGCDIFTLFEKLHELDMTTFIISDISGSEEELFSLYGIEDLLVDGVIHLKRTGGRRGENLLRVVKMGKTKYESSFFPLILENGKFKIVIE